MYSINLRYPLSFPLIELRDRAAKYRKDLDISLVSLFEDAAVFRFSSSDETILREFILAWVDNDEKMFGILSKFIEKVGLQP